jgi:DNA-binding MarR family transcriptional regulator
LTDTATDTHLELAARLRLSVARLARRLRQQTAAELTPSQSSALISIERQGPLTPSELAEIERIQRPTATRILGVLTERGFVARERDESDRRSSRVSITRAGADVLARGRRRKNAYLARRLETFDAEELETLERAAVLLERLIEAEQ